MDQPRRPYHTSNNCLEEFSPKQHYLSVAILDYIHVYIYIYVQTAYIHIQMYVYIYICVYVFICMYTYTHTYICIFVFIHLYIYTYTYAYTYMSIQKCARLCIMSCHKEWQLEAQLCHFAFVARPWQPAAPKEKRSATSVGPEMRSRRTRESSARHSWSSELQIKIGSPILGTFQNGSYHFGSTLGAQ